ncbi:Fe-S cluster assembly protein SufD [Isobaculum melis]|uniref:Fe-S cluster assembly protein SufD n=1 Tax=Isobaculum melis TaxID=142588 RepID=A0A1H9Q050_9LACT|nr:Fe-S cluster assembly protein SufD [Isobaculum melis]SER53926.1 Fe-S cluster assembly protein SufD [Isobaculum melis]
MTVANMTDYLDDLRAFSVSQEEPQWMLDLRIQMLEKIEDLDLPFIERVKINRWPLLDVTRPEHIVSEGNLNAFNILDEAKDNGMVIQYGQTTVMEQLPMDLTEQGVIFTDIFTAMREHSELVKEAYMQYAVKADEDKMTAFHAAFMNSGLFLYVPKNVVIEEPLEAIFIQDSTRTQNFVKHVLVLAETNSEFSYVEKFYTHGEEKNTANIIVEVVAKPGAKIKFSAVDQLGKETTTYFNRRGHLLKDATIDWALGIMNDGDVVADFDSDLIGEGSHSEVKVVAISTGSQIQGIDTRVTNYGRHSIGHILQHGVIRDKATLTFNGIGHIIKGAKGADAQQESRVLMLSDKARGDANPILLIDENDVTAGHAASVGRVDPEEMYYLMSRGIAKIEAERLVIRGFLGSVISAIPVKTVRDELVNVIEGKLTK